jgi:predicted metal-dependent phosphoesterase TrpH
MKDIFMTRSYASDISIPADSFIDLQTHTHLSDGKWTPEALIEYFVTEGFATAAITDHDRVDSIADVQSMARERGFPLLVATEMTTQWRDSIVDILCFGFENNPSPLSELCDRILQAQSNTSRQVYQYLVDSGHIPHYDEAELSSILDATTSRQPHLLVDLFIHHNPSQDDFSPLKKAGYKLCTNPTEVVVEAVHQCGGVALIAHPGRTDGFATFDSDLLDQFCAEIPIDGIEVYYPRHTPEQVALYQAYANQRGWLISAGSDSHASEQPPIKYRADQCMALLGRLDIKVL